MGRFAVLLSVVLVVVLGTAVLGEHAAAVAQEASPAADCPATSEAENVALARTYTEEHWTNPDVRATLLADEVVVHRVRGDQIYTAEEAAEADRAFGAAFPDV